MIFPLWVFESSSVIAADQFGHRLKILFEIRDKHRPREHGIRDRLRDFRFSAARYGAWFVAERPLRHGSDQPPGAASIRLFHMDLVPGRTNVRFSREHLDFLHAAPPQPTDALPRSEEHTSELQS